MINPNKHNRSRSSWRSQLTLGILVVLALILGSNAVSMYTKSREAVRNKKAAEAELQELKDKEARLTKEIETLKTPEGAEAMLRSKYPVVKEGEGVVVIVDDSKQDSKTGE